MFFRFTSRSIGTATAAALLLGASSLAAQAAPVSVSVTTVTGTWSNVTGAPPNLAGVGTGTISWGQPVQGDRKSAYQFVGTAPPTQTAPLDTSIALGTFTHQNYPITGGSITGATLNLTITGTLSDGGVHSPVNFSITSTYNFLHNETPNNYTPDSNPLNNDIVTATTNVAGSQTISFAGTSYIFSFAAFEVDGSALDSFSTVEGRSNSATFRGRLVATPGPVAGGGLSAALVLAGTAWIVRRRRRSA